MKVLFLADILWILIMSAIITAISVDVAYAYPPTFHQFYGEAKCYNGNDVNNRILHGIVSGKQSTTEISAGRYGYEPIFFVEGGNETHTILFKIK